MQRIRSLSRLFSHRVRAAVHVTLASGLFLAQGLPVHAAEHAVVLQYHHFGTDTPASTSLPVPLFEQHLAYLRDNGYQVWSLERILEHFRAGQEVPDKTVAISIDDAYSSVYERAFPLLKEYDYPFTVFVATEPVEQGLKGFMTWAQMREMQGRGATFANHSHTHAYLIRRESGESERAWRARVRKDIETAGVILERELGTASKLFAYPFGEYNSALMEIAQELGLTGIGQQSGAIWRGNLAAPLPRYPMAADFALMDSFTTKVQSLALPVIEAEPGNPELSAAAMRPRLRLSLAPGDYRADAIACFASGQAQIETRWLDRERLILEVQAKADLPSGRSRYNCTAPHNTENRFFWYSHPWVRP